MRHVYRDNGEEKNEPVQCTSTTVESGTIQYQVLEELQQSQEGDHLPYSRTDRLQHIRRTDRSGNAVPPAHQVHEPPRQHLAHDLLVPEARDYSERPRRSIYDMGIYLQVRPDDYSR